MFVYNGNNIQFADCVCLYLMHFLFFFIPILKPKHASQNNNASFNHPHISGHPPPLLYIYPLALSFLSYCVSHSPRSPLHKSWDSSALMDN